MIFRFFFFVWFFFTTDTRQHSICQWPVATGHQQRISTQILFLSYIAMACMCLLRSIAYTYDRCWLATTSNWCHQKWRRDDEILIHVHHPSANYLICVCFLSSNFDRTRRFYRSHAHVSSKMGRETRRDESSRDITCVYSFSVINNNFAIDTFYLLRRRNLNSHPSQFNDIAGTVT